MSSTVLNQMVASGLQIQQEIGGSGLKGAVIGNSSNLQATVVLQGAGISRTLYPYTVDFFDAPHDASGNLRAWSGNLVIAFATGTPDAGAYVQVDTIGATEPFKNTYPISLSRGAVNSTTVGNTLSYETGSAGILVVDIGTNAHNQDWKVYNDGSATLKVEQSGTPHTAVTLRSSGKPVAFGQAGDHVEVVGALDVDQNMFIMGTTTLDNGGIATDGTGHLILSNATNGGGLQIKDSGGTVHNVMDVSAGNQLEIRAPGNTTQFKSDDNNTNYASISNNGIALQNGTIGLITGSLSRISLFTGVGTGTYNHGLGTTPDFVIPICTANGSQTMGYDTVTSTQVHITCGAGLSFAAIALKF